LSLFEFLAAESVIFAVDIETVAGTYALEDDFASAGNRKRQIAAAETRFCKRTASLAVRLKDLQHIAALVIENGIRSFAGLVDKCVFTGAAIQSIVTCAACVPLAIIRADSFNLPRVDVGRIS